MKTEITKSNGTTESKNVFFHKGGNVVASIYLERHFINGCFDCGTITIRYNNENIYVGECVYHNEDKLSKTFKQLLNMLIDTIDYDSYFSDCNYSEKWVRVKEED